MHNEAKDEIWLSHLRGRSGKWIALVGEYPHTLAAEANTPSLCLINARRNGFEEEATLFFVPPPHPLCTTPLPLVTKAL